MDSIRVLHQAAKAVFGYGERLKDYETVLVERARVKFREQLYLMDTGRLEFHGLAPRDLVKAIFGQELVKKPCDCPGCIARREGT